MVMLGISAELGPLYFEFPKSTPVMEQLKIGCLNVAEKSKLSLNF